VADPVKKVNNLENFSKILKIFNHMEVDRLLFYETNVTSTVKNVMSAFQGSRYIIAFSGGLDSSFLGACAPRDSSPILCTAGVESSTDIKVSGISASFLGLEHEVIEIEPREILDSIPDVARATGTNNPVVVSFTIPLYLVSKKIQKGVLVVGHGADELFGGYERYLRMPEDEIEIEMERDLKKARDGYERDRDMVSGFGIDLRAPFLDEKSISLAGEIPLRFKVAGGYRKIVLRLAAARAGLPPEVFMGKKKAIQYSSGIMRVLKTEAKRRDMTVTELVSVLSD
jgi:asparagine synthase (glutamine-hydrolysing)